MRRSDFLFKTACQQWHAKFRSCLEENRAEDLAAMRAHVERQQAAWLRRHGELRRDVVEASRVLAAAREEEASARLRLRMLGQLRTFMEGTDLGAPAQKASVQVEETGGDDDQQA